MNNSIRNLEVSSYKNLVKIKMKLLKPFLPLLSKIRITPNMLTLASASMGILIVYFFTIQKFELILIPVLCHIALDGLDGALARFEKRDSNQGKLLDLLAGNFVATLFFIGMFISGYITAPSMLLIITLNTFTEIISIKAHSTKSKLQSGGLCHLGKIFIITISLVEFQFKIGLDLNGLTNITSFYLGLLGLIFLLKIER